MPTFKYIVRNAAGSQQEGSLVAENEPAVLRTLSQQGLYPLKVWQEGEAEAGSIQIRGRVKLSELSNFYNQLGDLLRAGVPILRALDVLGKQDAKRPLGGIIREMKEDVTGGVTLGDAMEKHTVVFPELHVGMVRAGEQGGFLEPVLHRLAGFVDQKDQLRNKVIGSMIYPVFLLIVGFAIVIVMVTFFMPKLKPMFQGMELPALTVAVMGLGDFLTKYYLFAILIIVLVVTLIFPYFRSEAGRYKFQKLQLYLPFFGNIMKMVSVCRFCRIFGTLLGNGVQMIPALNISRESAGNVILADLIGEAAEAVRTGKGLSKTFSNSDLFPADIVSMISVAEESNRLPEVLVEIADTQESRLAKKVDIAVRMLEPMMLLVVFGMVFVLALALLLPILQMSSGGAAGLR
jgi:general secretion pathway protein F/type IV pilus assembly protein PilC